MGPDEGTDSRGFSTLIVHHPGCGTFKSLVWQKMGKKGWYPTKTWQNVRKGGEAPLVCLMAPPEEEWVVGRKLGTLRRSPPITPALTRPQILIHYKYTPDQNLDLDIFNSDAAWMSDGACVWKCVYETLWNIVGRQNNVEKMSGSVFKRYQVSGLELWRGGGRSQYSLCLRTSDSFDSCRRESFIASRLPQGANM